jgi:cytochrome c551/c552
MPSEETYIKSSKANSYKIQISEGEKLIAKSDCIGCHNKDKKVVGPSYVDILINMLRMIKKYYPFIWKNY